MVIARRLLSAAALMSLFVARPTEVEAQGEAADSLRSESPSRVTRASCSLDGKRGSIVIDAAPDCDERFCPQWENVRVFAPNRRRVLTTEQEFSQKDAPVPLEVRCKDGAVVLKRMHWDWAPSLRLAYDNQRGKLALPAELLRAINAGFDEPESPERLALFSFASDAFRVLLAPRREASSAASSESSVRNASDASSRPLNQIVALDDALRERMELLLAREYIRAGQWQDASEILEGKSERRAVPTSAFTARRRELLAELERVRAQTFPLSIAERLRVGSMLKAQSTPLEPGVPATLFWRRQELCLVQEEQPLRFMRCYDTALRRWGERVPVAGPKLDGRLISSWPSRDECPSGQTAEIALVGENRDTDCAFDPNDLVGIVTGPALLFLGPQLVAFGQREAALDPARARALVASSSGSRALGQGCCWIEPTQRQLVDLVNPQERWDLVGTPPAGTWVGSPLASPDQRWLALQSQSSADKVHLWLFRVTPRPH